MTPSSSLHRTTTDTIRVLHVDDEPGFADMTAEFLQRYDGRFTVETTVNTDDALRKLNETPFDCVVSDYDMSQQNGLDLLKSVRETYPDLPFILFTGKGSEEIASDAISAGVSDYLQKGTGTERYSLLANRIENLVTQHRAQTRLKSRVEQQQCVADLGQTALGTTSLTTVFDQAVTHVSEMFNADYAKLLEYRSKHDDLIVRAVTGWENDIVDEETIGTGPDSQAGYTLQSECPVIVHQLQNEQRFQGSHLLREYGVVSGISVIVGSPNDPWGVLEIHTTTETVFTDDDITFVQNIANAVANAATRHAREQEFKQTTERLELALEEANAGIWEWNLATDELYWSDEFLSLLGISPDRFDGTINVFEDRLHPDDADQVNDAIEHTLETGEPYRVKQRILAGDGTYTWLDVRGQLIQDESRMIGVGFDITEQQQLEKELTDHVEALQTLYGITSEADVSFDEKQHRLLEFGCEFLDLPFGFITEITESSQHILAAVGDHELLQSGESCPIEQSYCQNVIDEEPRSLAIHNAVSSEVISEESYQTFTLGSYIGGKLVINGNLIGTVCFADDEPKGEQFSEMQQTFVELLARWLSYEFERRYTTQRLEKQNERLESFAGVVSHDLRNPLSVAQGWVDMVRTECDTEHQSLDHVEHAHDRMEQLITDILTLAREGETVSEFEPIPMRHVVENCWENVQTYDAELVCETNQTVYGDEGRLRQIIENLFRNSIEHGGDDVTVRIGTLPDGFYVEDDGPGIPESERERVFETGYSTGDDGTGFGLSILKEIVKAHGWQVSLTEAESGGTRFEFTGVETVQ